MSAASAAVRLAAQSLPPHLRARYREQWLADLRDAEEAGVPASDIAFGSLAFAVTLDRAFFTRAALDPAEVTRRSRLAVGLTLSSALLALTNYTALVSFGGLTGNLAYDLAAFLITATLTLYAFVAPVIAITLVVTRGTSVRARVSVVLLVVASGPTVAQRLIDSGLGAMDNIYLSPGTAAYAVALALVVAAGVLQPRPLPGRSPLASVVGAAVVWLLIGLGVAFGVGAWAGRSALPEGLPLGALDAGWLERERQFTQLAQSVFWGWAIAGAILGILVLLVGRRMVSRSAIALTVGAVALVVISASGVMNFVALGMSFDGPEKFIEPLRLVGQVLLVGVVLASVGGVHYEPKSPAEVAVS